MAEAGLERGGPSVFVDVGVQLCCEWVSKRRASAAPKAFGGRRCLLCVPPIAEGRWPEEAVI